MSKLKIINGIINAICLSGIALTSNLSSLTKLYLVSVAVIVVIDAFIIASNNN